MHGSHTLSLSRRNACTLSLPRHAPFAFCAGTLLLVVGLRIFRGVPRLRIVVLPLTLTTTLLLLPTLLLLALLLSVLLLASGPEPYDAANKVLIWDEGLPDGADKVVAEVEFKMPVLALQFSPNRMVVTTELHMFVYSFPNSVVATVPGSEGGSSSGGGGASSSGGGGGPLNSITLLAKVATTSNPAGVLAVSQVGLAGYAATAGTSSTGSVYVLQISGGTADKGKLATGALGSEISCHPGEQVSVSH